MSAHEVHNMTKIHFFRPVSYMIKKIDENDYFCSSGMKCSGAPLKRA